MSGSVKKLIPRPLRRKLARLRDALRAPPAAPAPRLKSFHHADEASLSTDELLAFARHDAHRIEKAFYNRIFEPKRSYFEQRRANVLRTAELLRERKFDMSEPTLKWAEHIALTFDELEEKFIRPHCTEPQPVQPDLADSIIALAARRRSSRVWASEQPSAESLEAFAYKMIDAARWAPNSGDRQPWRFKIISRPEDKLLLKGLKEEHCYAAPCLIFVGTDRRVYGALGQQEAGLYIDAGAATMLMVLAAHASHYGVCWNHFSRDLIESRPRNREIYDGFVREMDIPDFIEPVAIVAFGVAAFHPPVPPRMKVESLLL
ncbi:nitroreductase family protein [Sphingosinicella terrae]|uniref:nitroreductase family protein n=1 Tax=Sphingosinicella terrae TaxID=2172047 RepID=UPI000E0DCD59|nr:nitroreductase family protein [Sphingosinicella terrae]